MEGIALGLMAGQPAPGSAIGGPGAGPWDWACEVAAACCGLVWDPSAPPADPAVLGGPRFNDEHGRQPYHDRERDFGPDAPFQPGLTHQDLLGRLRRLNGKLGWDHETTVEVPAARLATPEARAALWSALYAGAHAILEPGPVRGWDPAPFQGILVD